MYIKNIKLRDYRNYSKLDLDLEPNINIIIGDNGAGKTNILESITLISDTKSFRTRNDSELVKNDCEYSLIAIKTNDHEFKMVIKDEGKILYLDNTNILKTSKFIGNLHTVLFEPSNLELFSDSPKYRRRFLDLEIGKVSKVYLDCSLSYSKLLKERNILIKKSDRDMVFLKTIEERMIEPLKIIMMMRQNFIDFINTKINTYYHYLSQSNHKIDLIYEPSCDIDDTSIKKMFEKSFEKDLILGHTTKGVHKEDFNFYFDDHKICDYASQGQKRMVMIAFKLSLIDYIKDKINDLPILLLDDILSELDKGNKERLLKVLPQHIQTIITTTDLNDLSIHSGYRLIEIKKGGDINVEDRC